jgi:hypothetical protein
VGRRLDPSHWSVLRVTSKTPSGGMIRAKRIA